MPYATMEGTIGNKPSKPIRLIIFLSLLLVVSFELFLIEVFLKREQSK